MAEGLFEDILEAAESRTLRAVRVKPSGPKLKDSKFASGPNPPPGLARPPPKPSKP